MTPDIGDPEVAPAALDLALGTGCDGLLEAVQPRVEPTVVHERTPG